MSDWRGAKGRGTLAIRTATSARSRARCPHDSGRSLPFQRSTKSPRTRRSPVNCRHMCVGPLRLELLPLSRFWGHGWRPCPLPCHEVRTLPCLTSFSRSTKPLGAWGLRLQLCIGGREPRTVASSCRQGPGICASVRGELKSIVRGGCRERWVRFADCKRRGGASGVPLATSPAAHTAGGSRREGTDAGLRKDLRTTTGQRQPLDCLLPPREGAPGVGGEAARQAERARHRA